TLLDERGTAYWTDDEARSGGDRRDRRSRVDHGAGADHDRFRERPRHLLDPAQSTRDGHRDLDDTDAAGDQRVDDLVKTSGVGQADDRDRTLRRDGVGNA